jgi:hypothetical protein
MRWPPIAKAQGRWTVAPNRVDDRRPAIVAAARQAVSGRS